MTEDIWSGPEDEWGDVQPPDVDVEGQVDDGEGRRLRLTPADQIQLRVVHWLWDGRVPAGQVTLVPGRAGIGKSTLVAWLTAQVTRGTLAGITLGKPAPVIYAATEDSWSRTIGPRLLAAGADMKQVFRVDVETGGTDGHPLSLPVDCRALATEIKAMGVAMLALDPLMSTISTRVDTHSNRELRTALEPLSAMADGTGCAVVGLAHFRKSSAGGDPLTMITGSSAFGEVIRAAIGIARDPDTDDGTVVLSMIKNNLGRDDLPSLTYVVEDCAVEVTDGIAHVGRVRFTGESARSVRDILTDQITSPEDRSDRLDAASWLQDFLGNPLRGGEAAANDVFKAGAADGFTRDVLKRAKDRAGVRSVKTAGGWVWQLTVTTLPEATDGVRDDATVETTKGAPREQGSQAQSPAPLLPSPLPWPSEAVDDHQPTTVDVTASDDSVPCLGCDDPMPATRGRWAEVCEKCVEQVTNA